MLEARPWGYSIDYKAHRQIIVPCAKCAQHVPEPGTKSFVTAFFWWSLA